MLPTEVQEGLARRFRRQAETAIQRGSPLYVELLHQMATDILAAGPTWAIVAPDPDEPDLSALPLRLLAGVHRLVLSGEAPQLAGYYPSTGGTGSPRAVWPALRRRLEERRADLHELTRRPHQTNEVARCAALLPAFLEVAARTRLPLRMLELGASAGLALNWHRYRYEQGPFGFGPARSGVRISGRLRLRSSARRRPGGARPARGL
jgi:hypothetical protein